MKLTFRTVSGESFQLDAETSTTVGGLKDLLVESRSIARECMKLVHKGKVLENESATVGESSIDESTFVVLFMTKKVEAPKAAPSPAPVPAAAPASQPAAATTPAAPAAAEAPPAPANASEAPAAEAAAAEPGAGFGGLLTGGALETAVNGICEMGFAREEVVRAMRAAFNNPERAVEYLTMGMPASAAAPPPPAAAAPAAGLAAALAPAVAAAQAAAPPGPGALPFNMFGPAPPAAAGAAPAPVPGGATSLDFLRNSPQFQILRQAVRGNPQILTPMLQELGRANPQLIQLIQTNQQDFLRILQEEPGEGEMDLEAIMGGMGMGGEGGEGAEGGMVVELSEEDVAKVERLQGLGFQRDACIEALLACDHNEEMAANFLAEQMFD